MFMPNRLTQLFGPIRITGLVSIAEGKLGVDYLGEVR
jgi:hypothetical protein